MNRIILIGNGFDLAHGLKTSYKNFMDWFWEQQCKDSQKMSSWLPDDGYLRFVNNFIKLKSKSDKGYTDVNELKQNIISYENKFLQRIEKTQNITNWLDLEELYYMEMKLCLKMEKENNDLLLASPIEQLNKDFKAIADKFEEYLIKKIENKIVTGNVIKKNEIERHIQLIDSSKERSGQFKGKILFLNFNYTHTEQLYGGNKENTIHIHGELEDDNDKKNPIIFGYGDELSDDFKVFENLNRNEFFENVKSIRYLETQNYDTLRKFIEEDEYEIFIFGHSCGNCDRTLLNTLFEHPNCNEVKIFYYRISITEDKYGDTSKNISRSFKEKSKLRNRVTKKENCVPLCFKDELEADWKKFKNDNLIFIGGLKSSKYTVAESKKEFVLDNYHIGKYPVTQKFFTEIMGYNRSFFTGDNLPVENVDWYEAVTFCNKLSEKYGLKKYYNVNGNEVTFNEDVKSFRLPRESEWEYAARHCRKDGTVISEKGFAGCEDKKDLKDYAWFTDNSDRKTHEVGTAPKANELAIHDMSGNVREWCEDLYNPAGASRVLRGGSWSFNAGNCTVSYRNYNSPDRRYDFVGFRLVLPQ